MKNNFDKIIEHTLVSEGGYVNDPKDAGGETKYGISKRAYPSVNIKILTKESAKLIYKRDYWDKCKCDDLPTGLDFLVFDFAVNAGVSRSIKLLQKTLNLEQDGIIGKNTISKANEDKNIIDKFVKKICDYYKSLNQPRFINGWLNRALRNNQYAIALRMSELA